MAEESHDAEESVNDMTCKLREKQHGVPSDTNMPPARTTLSRSCNACIRAKRRCSLDTPSCLRCSLVNLRCTYENPLSTQQSVQQMPFVSATDPSAWSVARANRSDDFASVPWIDMAFLFETGSLLAHVRPTFDTVSLTLDSDTTEYILGTLRTAAQKSLSICVHDKLLATVPVPSAITRVRQLVVDASTLVAPERREDMGQDLEDKTRALIAYVHRRPFDFPLLLQSTQALLASAILLTISPLAPDISSPTVLARRTKLLKTLSNWCRSLWKHGPWSLPQSTPAGQSWLFAESVRRTLLVAHLLCDVFSVVQTGVFRFSGFVTTLPYDTRTWMWEEGSLGEQNDVQHSHGHLQSFRQLVMAFEQRRKDVSTYNELEVMLLVACRGYKTVARQFGTTRLPAIV